MLSLECGKQNEAALIFKSMPQFLLILQFKLYDDMT